MTQQHRHGQRRLKPCEYVSVHAPTRAHHSQVWGPMSGLKKIGLAKSQANLVGSRRLQLLVASHGAGLGCRQLVQAANWWGC